MKNNLLLIMLLASGFTGSAQQSFAEGFDTFDFTLGDIQDQNGWQALTFEGIPFGGCSISNDDIQMFSNPYYLKIDHDPNSPASDNLDYFCLSPSLNTVPFQLVQGEASVSVYIQTDDDSQTTGANYAVQFDDGVHVTASVLYLNDGTIAVADKINGILLYMPTNATWNAGENRQLNISINLQAGTLRYNIQGEDIYSGHVLNGVALERFAVSYDNQPGSVAYFDSIFVFGHNEVLGTQEPELSQIRLYPNPATDILTILGPNSLTEGSVTLYGIDGKVLPVTITEHAQGSETMDVSSLASGTYFIGIQTDEGIVKRKFIKQ